MAKRENNNGLTKIFPPEVSADSDLSLRLRNISEKTGLPPLRLLQKWIFQEETLIGLMQPNKEPSVSRSPKTTDAVLPAPKKPSARKKGAKAVILDPSSPEYYRNALVQRIEELKSDGMTLKKIAEILNEEKAPTMSGTGKWYASSVTYILRTKK